jgi:diaminohydroxyphosphoribosylaminopyrimidine deaminase/5-amino-6-(5-phosphoribosylamino)uracil reductase
MKTNHNNYLNLAFHIAERNLGQTGLNPSVGSVIVRNDSVISSDVTSINGRPHSEFNALNKIHNCRGASLYTTLEPCTHFGKTPPCVNLIIKKGIKKVFYAFDDPDLRTYRKARDILKKKGIQTRLISNKRYKNFYKSYFKNKKKNLPLVTAKIAVSKDFFTINKKKERWITNLQSRKISHLLRSKFDCVISTSKSINLDNSLLNTRIDGLNYFKPDLFIVDLNLKLKKNLFLNKIIKKRKTYIITKKENSKKSIIYKKKGFKMIFINSLINKDNFKLLFKKIYKKGYSRVFIESGLTFLNKLIKFQILDDLYIFKSNVKLGKHGKNNISSKYIKYIKSKVISVNLKNDRLFKKVF